MMKIKDILILQMPMSKNRIQIIKNSRKIQFGVCKNLKNI